MTTRLYSVVISGLSYSGKSHYLNLLKSPGVFDKFALISADYFRNKILGDRPATLPEQRVFREAVWFEIKRNLVIERTSTLLEMVLKTDKDHWRPLTNAVENAQTHLSDMVGEKADCDYRVDLKVVTLFNDPESLDRRIKHRLNQLEARGNVTGTYIFDLQSFSEKSGIDVFELPDPDRTLFVDTSEESQEALDKNLQEIIAYVFDDISTEQQERYQKAQKYLSQLKNLAGC